MNKKQVIVVCRHGDRFDYAYPDRWRALCEKSGGSFEDPPLSALGKSQAEALGHTLKDLIIKRGGQTRLISSPYLRCLETSMPTSRLLGGLDVSIERQLAEVRHRDNKIPQPKQRLAYFPYLKVPEEDGGDPRLIEDEDWPVGYLWRMSLYAQRLRHELNHTHYSTTVLFSHAASLALVAALCESELKEELRFAPTGAYYLARENSNEKFHLESYRPSPSDSLQSIYTEPWFYSTKRLMQWQSATGQPCYPPPIRNLPILEISDAQGIQDACARYGAFYLRDCVKEELCLKCANESRRFFAASIKEKQAISYEQSSAFRGYMMKGTERTKGKIDAREQIELGQEAISYEVEDPVARRLIGPNQWPPSNNGLKSVSELWIQSSAQAAASIVSHLGNFLDSLLAPEPYWQAKLCSYPPSGHVGAHTDSGLLTLVWQDAPGLEICHVDGQWIPAPPLPNTVVCTVGEMLQLASNGRYRAAPHRVHASSLSPRMSLPFFYNPSLNACISTASQADTEEYQYNDHRFLRAYGRNAFKSLARSHPSVFAKHHPDLTLLSDGSVVFS